MDVKYTKIVPPVTTEELPGDVIFTHSARCHSIIISGITLAQKYMTADTLKDHHPGHGFLDAGIDFARAAAGEIPAKNLSRELYRIIQLPVEKSVHADVSLMSVAHIVRCASEILKPSGQAELLYGNPAAIRNGITVLRQNDGITVKPGELILPELFRCTDFSFQTSPYIVTRAVIRTLAQMDPESVARPGRMPGLVKSGHTLQNGATSYEFPLTEHVFLHLKITGSRTGHPLHDTSAGFSYSVIVRDIDGKIARQVDQSRLPELHSTIRGNNIIRHIYNSDPDGLRSDHDVILRIPTVLSEEIISQTIASLGSGTGKNPSDHFQENFTVISYGILPNDMAEVVDTHTSDTRILNIHIHESDESRMVRAKSRENQLRLSAQAFLEEKFRQSDRLHPVLLVSPDVGQITVFDTSLSAPVMYPDTAASDPVPFSHTQIQTVFRMLLPDAHSIIGASLAAIHQADALEHEYAIRTRFIDRKKTLIVSVKKHAHDPNHIRIACWSPSGPEDMKILTAYSLSLQSAILSDSLDATPVIPEPQNREY